jgi:glutathione S-transferase
MILFFSCEQFFDLNLVLVRFSLGLDYEYIPVNLLKGDQSDSDFKKINPMGTVPALVDGDVVINDSFAIIMVSSNTSI